MNKFNQLCSCLLPQNCQKLFYWVASIDQVEVLTSVKSNMQKKLFKSLCMLTAWTKNNYLFENLLQRIFYLLYQHKINWQKRVCKDRKLTQ